MDSIHNAIPEEIAFEGLDGITLDTLWFRLSERLKYPYPFNLKFCNELWKVIKSRRCFEFFLIDNERATPQRMDRRDYYFNSDISDDVINGILKSSYYIYSYHPINHPVLRGSCEEFYTRQKLSDEEVKAMSVEEINENFGKRFVIVASQTLRSSVLIPKNLGRDCDINNVVYCILERIGRSRYFGEATSGAFSLNDFVKDSKLLHYFRNTLLKNRLVVRQQLNAKIRGQSISCQLFHLPRFHIVVRASNMLMTEQLFDFLKKRQNHMAEIEEAKILLNVKQKSFVTFIRSRSAVFKYNHKTPYRECYPDATKEQYMLKNKGEKTLTTVSLVDPDLDIFKLWHMECDDLQDEDEEGFLDTSKQQLNRPLIYQVCQKIEEAGKEGMSQHEIGKYFGLSKLNARSVLRKVQRQRNISFYMKDEGRQRVSKYVTKDAAHDASQQFVAEMAKLLMKADEASIQVPMPIVSPESSPTKVSIPLSPNSLKLFKFEPPAEKPVIQFIVPEPVPVAKQKNQQPVTQVVLPLEDSSFIDNVQDVSVSMRFLNNIPGTNKQSQGITQAVAHNKVSEKVLTRMNTILDIMKSKITIDSMNLLHLMRQTELNFPEMICRKSMLSLCARLAADNLLKVVEMELKSSSKTVKLIFFAEPNVSFDMKCWHSIIEEQKIQHFIALRPSDAELGLLRRSRSLTSFVSKTSVASEEFGPQSKRYENFPKFMKMKLFHEFLFYLVYAYPEDNRKIPIRKAMESWCKENPKILDHDDITESITCCYSTEISWKMFVSPLNKQREYETGWALIRDIIHRIPLILFVKFSRLGQESPELREFLMHPIKCNYLLHFLPGTLREQLLSGRKYVFVIQELCKRLCWCGLLQFGPSRTKEVDQSFIYLNRKASLLDTTTSDVGYLEVSDNDYEKIDFYFDTTESVANYWNRMFEISCNTKINKKSTAIGKTVEIEQLSSKPGLQNALKVQTPISAPLNDLGEIPGDHKGAAGLDKAFLTHLKRNWTRPLEGVKRDKIRQPKVVANKIKREKASVVKEAAAKIRNKTISSAQSKFKSKAGTSGVSEKSKVIRKIAPVRRVKKKAQMSQDAVDVEALKRMNAMRVSWSELEDKTLILTKVALKFAFPQDAQSSHYISMTLVRDILHWRTEKALNKTSKACSRRLGNLIKSQPVKEQIALYLEELRSNRDFTSKYKNLVERLKKIYRLDEVYEAMKVHIVEMVHRMHQIFYKQYLVGNKTTEKRTITELPKDFRDRYTITNPANTLVDKKYADPTNHIEAEVSMLMSLVHSVVCCTRDKTSYSYYNFEVLKKFAETQVSSAVSQLRRATVISHNKNERSKDTNVLSSYHLTTRYGTQLLGIHVPVELYDEYMQAIKTLSSCEGSYQMTSLNCGWIFMLAEMVCSKKIQLSYDLADKLVMVDPALRKKTNFDKISDDYLKLREEKQEKKSVKLPTEDSVDETFVFVDDPIEIFLKVNVEYLHAFCIIKEMLKSGEVMVSGECRVDGCVVMNEVNFEEEIRKISCNGRDLVREMLDGLGGAGSSATTIVKKENFVAFFDDLMATTDLENKNRKDFSAKSLTSWKRMTALELLEAIYRLSTEAGLEEDTWLTEYHKITRCNEEDRLDDEEIDQIKHSKMFKQLRDLNLNARTSDSFVVNLSTIYVDVKGDGGEKVTFQDGEFDSRLMPFTEVERQSFIDKILSDAKWKPEDLEPLDLVEVLSAAGITNTIEIMKLSEVVTFLQSKTQMGATAQELLENFDDKFKLHDQMETLIDLKFVLRVGVNETRFIHRDFVAFWLIDTFYTVREEKDAQEPLSKKPRTENDPPEKPVLVRHPIRIKTAPWIRINGTLNRRVVDKWLGTLLNHLTINPSMMLSDLCVKFNVLKPFEVRSLCEILQMIGSIQMMSICEPEVDLFSSYQQDTTPEPATFFCPNEKIFIELQDDAMQRLTFFIGRKKYKNSFV